ncbi:type I restriction endonuclease [Lentilactobacillus senioris]|uniref:type I restriction endonuclease n=1 Tax=Lentilactobacillus senioris TaxID=931534 RepID=UPI003D2D7C0B
MERSEFGNKIEALSDKLESLEGQLNTEEATKNALILPFLATLGYNVFDPTELVPEFTADFGSKKGERVDYAIVLNGDVQILIETKEISDSLEKRDSQLFRYFTATKAKFGILTNGNTYKFYTDLDEPNVMDKDPFLTVHISNIKESQINELFKFTKENFDVDNITDSASDLKYVSLAKDYLEKQMKIPDDEFVKLVLADIYDGMRTQQVIDQFRPVIVKGLTQIVSEKINSKLSNALNQTVREDVEESDEDTASKESSDDGIVTTPEELEAYTITKLILKDILDPERVFYRDNRSYFNVLADNSNRKWIIRIYFHTNRNFIVLHDDENTELDFKDPIDIYEFAKQIQQVAEQYK